MDIRRVEMADDETRSRIVAPLAEMATRTDFAMSPRFLTLALSDYEAMGYRPFGRLPDYPKGEERIFYAKIFGDQTQTAGEA